MGKLLIGAAFLAVVIGGVWYGGESWLSERARRVVEQNPQITAQGVVPLRDPGRVGVRLDQIEYGDAGNGFTAPDLEVYVPAAAPNRLTAALPRQMSLRIGPAPVALELTQGTASITLSPLHQMSVGEAAIDAQGLRIDGAEIFDAVNIHAEMVHMGGAAPAGSASAYAIDIDAGGIAVAGLPDRLRIDGPVQLWLDALPRQALLEGSAPPPLPTGLQSRGLRFSLGGMQASLIGRIEADAQGYASGEAAFYTDDAQGFIDAAVNAGLLPPDGAMMARAMLNNLATTPVEGDEQAPAQPEQLASTSVDVVAEAAEGGTEFDQIVSLPPAQPGQIRLPVILKEGQIRLGPVPIGPAPRMIP